MQYMATGFQELVEIMASCDRLGLYYIVQKDYEERNKWFGSKKETKVFWTIKVIQYSEEVVEDGEETDSRGGQGEGASDGEVSDGTETN